MNFTSCVFRKLTTLGLFLFLVAAGVSGQTVRENFDRSVALAKGASFSLSNVNGSVRVDGWEKDYVQIRATKLANGPRANLRRVQVHVDEAPGEVRVWTEYPEDDGVEVIVEYQVRVPYRTQLARVETVNGKVEANGVEGTGTLRSVNGDVELTGASGRYNLRSTNGSIRAEFRGLPDGAPITVETMNGSVWLAVPESSGFLLDAQSLNGDFRSELPLLLRGARVAREYRGQYGKGGGAVRVRTVNGGIRVVAARPTV